MKKYRLLAGFLALMVLAAGCGHTERKETGENTGKTSEEAAANKEGSSEQTNEVTAMTEGESITQAVLPDKLAERYLSAFRQVFFDPLGKARPGKLLYTLTLVPVKGGEIRLEVFEKLASSGNPAASAMLGAAASASPDSLALEPLAADIFKAVVMFRRDGNRADTVQMPYVVLDKMVKRASWFGQDW